jgi:hypothetical protein
MQSAPGGHEWYGNALSTRRTYEICGVHIAAWSESHTHQRRLSSGHSVRTQGTSRGLRTRTGRAGRLNLHETRVVRSIVRRREKLPTRLYTTGFHSALGRMALLSASRDSAPPVTSKRKTSTIHTHTYVA